MGEQAILVARVPLAHNPKPMPQVDGGLGLTVGQSTDFLSELNEEMWLIAGCEFGMHPARGRVGFSTMAEDIGLDQPEEYKASHTVIMRRNSS